MQLRISERSGRGVPKIVGKYGKESIKIEKNRIIVTIPFNKINVNSFKILSNNKEFKFNKSQDIIIKAIRNNPNITTNQLMNQTNLTEQGVKKNIKILKENKIIERIGAKKNGYWKVNN